MNYLLRLWYVPVIVVVLAGLVPSMVVSRYQDSQSETETWPPSADMDVRGSLPNGEKLQAKIHLLGDGRSVERDDCSFFTQNKFWNNELIVSIHSKRYFLRFVEKGLPGDGQGWSVTLHPELRASLAAIDGVASVGAPTDFGRTREVEDYGVVLKIDDSVTDVEQWRTIVNRVVDVLYEFIRDPE